MNRICVIVASILLSMSCKAIDNVEYIRRMFSPENVRSKVLLQKDKTGWDILKKSVIGKNFESEERLELEKAVFEAIIDFEIPVDIDGRPCKYDIKILEDRSCSFSGALSISRLLRNDIKSLCKLAEYLGSIKESSMPTLLARVSISSPGFWDAYEDPKYEQQAFYAERETQRQTELVNIQIRKYRKELISICSQALPTWKRVLSEDEFKKLVDQLAVLGKMNGIEKAELEYEVIPYEEWQRRADAWWALPIDKRE